MKVIEERINTKSTTGFMLMPFGDLQVGSPLFVRSEWDRYLQELKAAKNAISIGMGDYTDHFRPTVQDWIKGGLHKDKDARLTVDEMHWEKIERDVLPLLRSVPLYSKCLGLLGGHHDFTYEDGTTSTQRLCRELNIPYLGDGEVMVRLLLSFQGCVQTLTLWATHGEGSGSGIGGAINALRRIMMSFPETDIFLRAHSCDLFALPEPVYRLTKGSSPKLVQHNRIYANTGGFSAGRVQGHTTYVEKRNLTPKATGFVKIPITVKYDLETKARYLHLGGNQ